MSSKYTPSAIRATVDAIRINPYRNVHLYLGTEPVTNFENDNELEYVMVIGVVCLSGIALLILVSLGLMVSTTWLPPYDL